MAPLSELARNRLRDTILDAGRLAVSLQMGNVGCNVAGCVGTFCLLPGVWDRLDVPVLTIMSAPNASMVVSAREDRLFPPEGQQGAARQIRLGYERAGCPGRYSHKNPAKPHCYDAEIQREAVAWFDAMLAS